MPDTLSSYEKSLIHCLCSFNRDCPACHYLIITKIEPLEIKKTPHQARADLRNQDVEGTCAED